MKGTRRFYLGKNILYWGTLAVSAGTMTAPSISQALSEPSNRRVLLWPSSISSVVRDLDSENAKTRNNALPELEKFPRGVLLQQLPQLIASPHIEVRLAAAHACRRLKARGLSKLFINWLSEPNARLRLAAAVTLQALPISTASDALIRALRDPEPTIQIAVTQALGRLGDAAALTALLGELNNPQGNMRVEVAAALAKLGDRRAVIPILRLLADPLPEVRQRAIKTLSELRDFRALGGLMASLEDANDAVRAAAARALGNLRAITAVSALRAVAQTDTSRRPRHAAIEALGTIGTPEALRGVVTNLNSTGRNFNVALDTIERIGAIALPYLKSCIAATDSTSVISACLQAVGTIRSREATVFLVESLSNGTQGAPHALEALGRIGMPEALPTVLRYLDADDPLVKKACFQATEKLLRRAGRGGTAVGPLHLALLSATERNQQIAILRLLGLTRSQRAQAFVLPYAESTDSQVQTEAIDALGHLGGSIPSDAVLLRHLSSISSRVSWAAAIALRKSGGSTTVAPLLKLLKSNTTELDRYGAVALSGPLARSSSDKQRSWVLKKLTRARGSTADVLAEGLGLTPGLKGLTSLLTLSQSKNAAMRSKVAELLAFHHAGAVATLRILLSDRSERVRANAVWSLGVVGTRDDIPVVDELLDDPSWSVSANAVAASGKLRSATSSPAPAPSWCKLLKDERSHRVVNALTTLRLTNTRCEEGDAQWLLHSSSSPLIRRTAALYLSGDSIVEPKERRTLLHLCTTTDPSGRVAHTCANLFDQLQEQGQEQIAAGLATPKKPTSENENTRKGAPLSIMIVQADTGEPRPGAAFGLLEPTGWIRNGWADRRGTVVVVGLPEHGEVELLPPAFLTQ